MGWEVSVSVNGEEVLTISDQHLSGIDNVLDFDEEINEAARSLLGFIGKTKAVEYPHIDCFYSGGRGCMNMNLTPDKSNSFPGRRDHMPWKTRDHGKEG